MDVSIEKRINQIAERFHLIEKTPLHYNYFIDVKDIDLECQKIGKEILDQNFSLRKIENSRNNTVVFITTVLLSHGGGARMLEDYINIYKKLGMECVIIVTGLRESHKEVIKKFQANAEVILINSDSYYGRIFELQNLLAKINPEITFMFHFHSDFVALCGVQKELVNKIYLVLILDHSVSIGVHIPYLTKIIVNRKYLLHYLRDKAGIEENKLCYIPLTKIDQLSAEKIRNRKYMVDGTVNTASCTSCVSKINDLYKYRFVESIVEILKITKGKHFHIGAINQSQLDFIKNSLKQLGIEEESFIHIPQTECLAQFFFKNDIDVLIQTFPIGGGLVTIEAMQAGLKIVTHLHAYSYIYNMQDWHYPEAFFWSNVEDFYNHMRSLNKENIYEEGLISRKYYEDFLMDLEHFFTRDDITGYKPEYDEIRKCYNYPLDIFSYLEEISKTFLISKENNGRNLKNIFSFKRK